MPPSRKRKGDVETQTSALETENIVADSTTSTRKSLRARTKTVHYNETENGDYSDDSDSEEKPRAKKRRHKGSKQENEDGDEFSPEVKQSRARASTRDASADEKIPNMNIQSLLNKDGTVNHSSLSDYLFSLPFIQSALTSPPAPFSRKKKTPQASAGTSTLGLRLLVDAVIDSAYCFAAFQCSIDYGSVAPCYVHAIETLLEFIEASAKRHEFLSDLLTIDEDGVKKLQSFFLKVLYTKTYICCKWSPESSNSEKKEEELLVAEQTALLESLNLKKLMNLAESQSVSDLKCRNKSCGSDQISNFPLQLRSADEPMTIFCICRKCGTQWKII